MKNSSLVEKINKLKEQRNAVIIAHNYQRDEVQDIADFTGDSLGLSIQASQTDAAVIVFCGVHFMAETASILSPEKIVLLPDEHAGCPMADMINADQLRSLKAEHPGAQVVSYVNTTAEVKAETDVCCTSSNALKVVKKLHDVRDLIFVPDQYLGGYVGTQTGRNFILWNGYCPTHVKIQPGDIVKKKELYPGAKVVAHPECTPEVLELADEALSTEGICRYAAQSDSREIIVATEVGIIHRLEKENPGKIFIPASENATCPNMKKITLEKILWTLENMQYEVKVPEDIRAKALSAVNRMVEIV